MRFSRRVLCQAILFLMASLIYCRAFIAPFVRGGDWSAHYNPISFPFTGEWGGADHLLLTGHDWDMHYFFQAAVQRSLLHDRQWPFWNPWNLGGASLWGDPQMQFPTPLWVVNLAAGPIGGARLQVVLHHWIGLLCAWWLARRLGLSRRAAFLVSCIFMMSTWYSLHLAAGHAQIWSGAYMPAALSCLWLARRDLRWALGAAVWLALVIFEGGAYIYLIFLVLAGSMTFAWAFKSRSWRPVAALAIMILFSGSFAAVRLAPETALMARYPRPTVAVRGSYDQLKQDVQAGTRTAWVAEEANAVQGASTEPTMKMSGPVALIAQLTRVFLGRVQQVSKHYYRYQGYGWHEYGAYIGPIAVIFLLLGPFILWRQKSVLWPWLLGAAVCFLISVGNFASFSPWAILHHLPFYSQSRVPSRYLIPVVLCIAVVVAFVYDELWARFAARSMWARLALDILLIIGCADLALVGGRGFHNEAELTRVPIPPAAATVQTVVAGPQQQTALMMAGYRARNGDNPIPIVSHVAALGETAYKGEVYFESLTMPDRTVPAGLPRVLEYRWSPGRMTLDAPSLDSGWVVWNMNWAPGWRSDPPGLVQSRGGLLAVALKPNTGPVTLYYVPERFELGLGISLLALLAAGAWLWLASRSARVRSDTSA
jgi:hypothetical protein